MFTGKALETVQGAGLLEHAGITLNGMERIENPGTSASRLLARTGVGGGIRAKEEAGKTTGGGRDQGLAMAFTLHDRQTVEVAAQSSHEHRIAIEVEVMRGNSGC